MSDAESLGTQDRIPDWTVDPGTRRSNSSPEFLQIVDTVKELIWNLRLGSNLDSEARMIVAQLAHVHGLGPRSAVCQELAQAIRSRPIEFRGEGRDRVGVIPSKENWAEFVESFGGASPGGEQNG